MKTLYLLILIFITSIAFSQNEKIISIKNTETGLFNCEIYQNNELKYSFPHIFKEKVTFSKYNYAFAVVNIDALISYKQEYKKVKSYIKKSKEPYNSTIVIINKKGEIVYGIYESFKAFRSATSHFNEYNFKNAGSVHINKDINSLIVVYNIEPFPGSSFQEEMKKTLKENQERIILFDLKEGRFNFFHTSIPKNIDKKTYTHNFLIKNNQTEGVFIYGICYDKFGNKISNPNYKIEKFSMVDYRGVYYKKSNNDVYFYLGTNIANDSIYIFNTDCQMVNGWKKENLIDPYSVFSYNIEKNILQYKDYEFYHIDLTPLSDEEKKIILDERRKKKMEELEALEGKTPLQIELERETSWVPEGMGYVGFYSVEGSGSIVIDNKTVIVVQKKNKNLRCKCSEQQNFNYTNGCNGIVLPYGTYNFKGTFKNIIPNQEIQTIEIKGVFKVTEKVSFYKFFVTKNYQDFRKDEL